MTRRLLSLLLLGLCLLPAAAQDIRIGTDYRKVTGPITGPAARDTAALVVAAKLGDGDWGARLQVRDSGGRLLWQSPLVRRLYDPRAYTIGNAGVSQLDVAGDIDGDGRGEVVVEEPQSDVRPQRFRVLAWNGFALVKLRSESLIDQGDGRFAWTSKYTPSSRWISKFVKVVAPGRCEVECMNMNGETKRLQVEATPSGFCAVR